MNDEKDTTGQDAPRVDAVTKAGRPVYLLWWATGVVELRVLDDNVRRADTLELMDDGETHTFYRSHVRLYQGTDCLAQRLVVFVEDDGRREPRRP